MEYIMYLEVQSSKEWIDSLLSQNALEHDSVWHGWAPPPDTPWWFDPPVDFQLWHKKGLDLSDQSRYFVSPSGMRIFIFEEQL